MKVSLEGTTEEFLGMAELLAIGRATRRATGVPNDKYAAPSDVRRVQANDDVPDRFREEGVQ